MSPILRKLAMNNCHCGSSAFPFPWQLAALVVTPACPPKKNNKKIHTNKVRPVYNTTTPTLIMMYVDDILLHGPDNETQQTLANLAQAHHKTDTNDIGFGQTYKSMR
eukprot:6457862-Amphidinium_carterae.2